MSDRITRHDVLRAARVLDAAGHRPSTRLIGLALRKDAKTIRTLVASIRAKGVWPFGPIKNGRYPEKPTPEEARRIVEEAKP